MPGSYLVRVLTHKHEMHQQQINKRDDHCTSLKATYTNKLNQTTSTSPHGHSGPGRAPDCYDQGQGETPVQQEKTPLFLQAPPAAKCF